MTSCTGIHVLRFDSKGHALMGLYKFPVFSCLKFSQGSVPPDQTSVYSRRLPNFVISFLKNLATSLHYAPKNQHNFM